MIPLKGLRSFLVSKTSLPVSSHIFHLFRENLCLNAVLLDLLGKIFWRAEI